MSLLLLLEEVGAPPPTPSVPVPKLEAVTVMMGLGGFFRQALIDDDDTVACWPLKELGSGPIKNIVRNNLHGVINGGGFSRGAPTRLPEGGLGLSFDGTGGYIQVQHDATPPVTIRSYDIVLNMSLSPDATGGLGDTSARIVFLIKTTTNDATLRCIVQKQETNSSGNGWHVGLINGGIEWYCKSAGVVRVNITRGSIADGAWHLVECARDLFGSYIYIDGVQSGSTGSSSGTLDITTANLRIGLFTDDSGPFIGTLAYVSLAMSVEIGVSATMQLAREWTEITPVLSEPGLVLDYGIAGTDPVSLVSSTGTAQLTLRNLNGSAIGYYTPGHANCRAGFDVGIPILIRMTYDGTDYDWLGTIKNVQPEPGQYLAKRVAVTAVDWIDSLAETPVTALPVQVDQATFELVGRVIDEVDIPPANTTFAQPAEIYPYAFDSSESEDMPALTEAQKLMVSGFGKMFIARESGVPEGGGGHLWYLDHTYIQGQEVVAQFDNSMGAIEVDYDRDAIINSAKVTFVPRADGTPNTVLHQIDSAIAIKIGETVIIEGSYTDPAQKGLRVGGKDFTFASGTDYAGFANENATGTNITSSLVVTVESGDDPGANRVVYTIRNDSEIDGFITTLQIRGTPIYYYEPVTMVAEDQASIRQYKRRQFPVTMPYQSRAGQAKRAARYILASRSSRLAVARSMSFIANASNELMTQALERDVGDLIELREAVTTGAVYVRYYIQRVRLEVTSGPILRCTWSLTPQGSPGGSTAGYWILGESTLGASTALGWG